MITSTSKTCDIRACVRFGDAYHLVRVVECIRYAGKESNVVQFLDGSKTEVLNSAVIFDLRKVARKIPFSDLPLLMTWVHELYRWVPPSVRVNKSALAIIAERFKNGA